MIILNEKILLRKPDMSDLEDLYLLKNDEETDALLGGFNTGYSREMVKDWIQFHTDKPNELIFVIQDAESGKLIGQVGLYNIDHRIRKAEFAIMIADKNYRGKGYGDLCTKYMLSYGFDQLNLNRIEVSLLSSNTVVIALNRKNGFVQEGLLKQAQYKNGSYQDILLMAKFKEDHK